MKSIAKILTLAVVLLGVGSLPVHATIVLSNLSQPDLCAGNNCVNIPDSDLAGQSFTTDASSYVLNSIDVLVFTFGGVADFVAIYSDVAGQPNVQVGTLPTFSGSVELGTYDRHTFTSDGSIILAPLTDYWLVVGSTSNFTQNFQLSTNLVSSGPFTLNNMQGFSSDLGASWSIFTNGEPVKFELDATAQVSQPVPEPGTFGLFGLGLAGLVAWRRKKAV